MLCHLRNSIRGIGQNRLFCSAAKLGESEFDSLALGELQHLADLVDTSSDSIDAENVEIHEGVLTIEFPKGTFVLNKHGASKQIWYSSPVSPPAYFEPLTDTGKKWWSLRLQMNLRDKLSSDILRLTGHRVELK